MKNSLPIFKIEKSIIARSLWFPICGLGTLLLMLLLYRNTIQSNPIVGIFLNLATYPIAFGIVSFLIMGVDSARRQYEVINTLNIKTKDLIIGKLMALYIFSLLITLEPIILLTFHFFVFKNLSASIFLNFLVEIIMIWGIAFITSATVGFGIGYFIKSRLSYVGALIAWSILAPFGNSSVNYTTISLSKNSLLNLCVTNINGLYNAFTLFVHDKFYLLDKLFSISLLLSIIFLCILIDRRYIITKIYKKYLIPLLGFLSICIIIWMNIHYFTPDIWEVKENIINRNQSSSEIKINNYKMLVELGNSLRNSVTITINKNYNNDYISFNLDKVMKVESITDNKNNKLKFIRKNNEILINLNKDLKDSREMTINIIYNGKVNYENYIGNKTVFSFNNSTFLPFNYNWFPIVGDNDINFNIEILSNNIVFTNLELKKVSNDLYSYEGKSKDLFIVSGNLISKDYNNKEIISPLEISNTERFKVLEEKVLTERIPEYEEYKKIYLVPLDYLEKSYLTEGNNLFLDYRLLY